MPEQVMALLFGLLVIWFIGSPSGTSGKGKLAALIDALRSTPNPNDPTSQAANGASVVRNADGSLDITLPDINQPTKLHIPAP